MTVLVLEDNLIWSVKLRNGLQSLGHEAIVVSSLPPDLPRANAAIVNLTSRADAFTQMIPRLKDAGIYVIAHAGHKDKQLLDVGRSLNCDAVVTNGILFHKLAAVLSLVKIRDMH